MYTNFEMLLREAKIKDLTGIKAIEDAENILKYEIYIVNPVSYTHLTLPTSDLV